MSIGMKIYLTLLVISFILLCVGAGFRISGYDIGTYLMLPFIILFVGGLIVFILVAIWRC